MPISIDEFESEDPPEDESVPRRVLTHLASNPDRAFTRVEIADALEADRSTVEAPLRRLRERNLVRHRGEYWAVIDDQERLRSAFDLHAITSTLDARDGGIDPEAWDEAAPDEPHPSERDGEE